MILQRYVVLFSRWFSSLQISRGAYSADHELVIIQLKCLFHRRPNFSSSNQLKYHVRRAGIIDTYADSVVSGTRNRCSMLHQSLEPWKTGAIPVISVSDLTGFVRQKSNPEVWKQLVKKSLRLVLVTRQWPESYKSLRFSRTVSLNIVSHLRYYNKFSLWNAIMNHHLYWGRRYLPNSDIEGWANLYRILVHTFTFQMVWWFCCAVQSFSQFFFLK